MKKEVENRATKILRERMAKAGLKFIPLGKGWVKEAIAQAERELKEKV